MARLNEPAAPTESIESLKRKFMRQNRDIARANSAQSLRIRNLENEVSRLLAENLDLREQISRYHNELENGQAQRISDHTEVVKIQLEEKLLELSILIDSLGRSPKPKKKSPKRAKITAVSPSQSPNQRKWKNMCSHSEAVADQEGRLPPILENKTYPRRTLDRQEILDIKANIELDTTDSPEIGPPPVSKFVDEDPVKIDLPHRNRHEINDDASGLDPALSINLEQRRKRKDSVGPSESRRTNRSEPVKTARENTGSLKTGAKRKLSVRDDEEEREVVTKPAESPDDFKYTRITHDDRTKSKTVSQPERSGTKAIRELAIARGAPQDKQPTTSVPPNRKVLAPKSVNNSPRKGGKVVFHDEARPTKPDMLKANPVKERRERKQEAVQIKASSASSVNTVEVQPEPETPAGLEIFSPPSSHPSTGRAESQDTPPPPDLGPGMEGQRPSRRARGAVSYAEPNLRDKMRRPTKDLIDAVARDDKAHRGSFVKLEDGNVSTEMKVKMEPEPDDGWKHMPVASSLTVENSPLRSKVSVPESLPRNITTHRKRRESLLHQVEAETQRPGSGSAIAALLAETRKAKAAAKEKDRLPETDLTVPNASSKLDIYDFKDTSPYPEETGPNNVKEARVSSRISRRYSSIPRDITHTDESEVSDMESTRKSDVPTRRRQSTLGLRGSSSSDEPANRESSEKVSKRPGSTIVSSDSNADVARSDRISARRRSMIL